MADENCCDPCCGTFVPPPAVEVREVDVSEAPAPVDPHSGDVYWEFLDKLEGDFRAFLAEARAGDLNKSAALRARKQSVVLRQSLKEYREVSVAHDRTHGRKNKTETAASKEIDAL